MSSAKPWQGPVILFDGVCNLCNGFVRFVIRRDPNGIFRFAALGSEPAEALLRVAGVPSEPRPDSIFLVHADRVHGKSSAALRIAGYLRFPWPLLGLLLIVPRPVRDAVYDAVAHRRYRWFGRRNACVVPAPELKTRFLP